MISRFRVLLTVTVLASISFPLSAQSNEGETPSPTFDGMGFKASNEPTLLSWNWDPSLAVPTKDLPNGQPGL